MAGIIILLILITGSLAEYCPNKVVIDPCVCRTTTPNNINIYCGGDKPIDLSLLFQILSKNLSDFQKKFAELWVNNTAISELKANTFKDITFQKIHIEKALNLSSIDKNAFNGTNAVTKQIILNENPKLRNNENNSLFEALSGFSNIQLIDISFNANITEIPSNAFTKRLVSLIDIYIRGPYVKKLGSNAFKSLPALRMIWFDGTNVSYIPDDAFDFDEPFNNTLDIDLEYNGLLNATSFAPKSFVNIGKPTKLWFGLTDFLPNQYPYWNETIFSQFLDSNENNVIDLWKKPVDCQDCRNYWLKTHPKLLDRVANIKCTTGLYVSDESNFKDCK